MGVGLVEEIRDGEKNKSRGQDETGEDEEGRKIWDERGRQVAVGRWSKMNARAAASSTSMKRRAVVVRERRSTKLRDERERSKTRLVR
jgi:hypothetical protein